MEEIIKKLKEERLQIEKEKIVIEAKIVTLDDIISLLETTDWK